MISERVKTGKSGETNCKRKSCLNFALSHHIFPREQVTQRKTKIITTGGFVRKYTLTYCNAKTLRKINLE
jgi:hypothetical protein